MLRRTISNNPSSPALQRPTRRASVEDLPAATGLAHEPSSRASVQPELKKVCAYVIASRRQRGCVAVTDRNDRLPWVQAALSKAIQAATATMVV